MVNVRRIARRVRDLREAADLQQRELAERCNISHSTISRLENGSLTNPKIRHLDQIARGLQVNLLELIGDDTDILEQIAAQINDDPDIRTAMVLVGDDLADRRPEQRRFMVELVQALLRGYPKSDDGFPARSS